MRNTLTDKPIRKSLIFGVFAGNIQSVYKYAKYEDTRCQEKSYTNAVMTFNSSTSCWGVQMQNLSGTFGHSDKKILFCFVFQKKLFTFALAFIIHRLMKVIWLDSLAQLVEHNTFNVGVMGSSPMRVTKR